MLDFGFMCAAEYVLIPEGDFEWGTFIILKLRVSKKKCMEMIDEV